MDPGFTSHLSLTPAQFEEHCRFLKADRNVIDLQTAVTLLDERGRLPRGVVALTFDDGLEGVYRYAYPVLVKYGLPATVFSVAGTLTGEHPTVDWIDGTAPGVLRAMTVDETLEMARDGIDFGSHSSRHLDLPSLDPSVCLEDLRHGRLALEEVLGRPVPHIAYPRGRHDLTVRDTARQAGHAYGFGLPEGPEPVGAFSIPRVGIYAHNSLPAVRIKSRRSYIGIRMTPGYQVGREAVRLARRAGAAASRAGSRDLQMSQGEEGAGEPSLRVGHVMSRWPKVSETFILNEVLELRRQGVEVELFPLMRERQPIEHPEATQMTKEATFVPFLSLAVLWSVVSFLRDDPGKFVRAVWDVLHGTWGNLNFFLGAVGILPKAVHMARLMGQRGVEHVHCHFATHPAVAGLVVQRLTGIPFSFTAHGSDLHKDQRMLGTKVSEAAFVTTVSHYNRDLILSVSATEDHSRVHVVHCGVDLEQFRPSRPPDGTTPMRIVCVGTLHEVKGQGVLVEACARILARGVKVECRFVGDGPDRATLAGSIRRLGLQSHVQLLGPMARQDVVREFDAADVVVAPSVPTASGRREGIPVVLMEGMAMERPVIASRLTGIPELVEDGRSGLLVSPGDVDGLATAIATLAADVDLRVQFGKAGRNVVAEAFNLSSTTRQLHALMVQARAQR